MATPAIEWRASTSPYGVISSQAIAGAGFGGAIPIGASSNMVTVRIYNNFAGASGIGDANNCQLAVYDDTIHQGTAITTPSTAMYVLVQCQDYNGTTTNGDTNFYPIGGQTKHAIPVNNGTIAGAAANYVTINIQVVVPNNAAQGAVSQGLWLEFNSSA